MTMPPDMTTAEDAEPNRRTALPVFLFVVTCLSTFWVGAVGWKPLAHLGALQQAIVVFQQNLHQGSVSAALQQALAVAHFNWLQGLFYMGVVMAILLSHEMGHFIMAWRHRIPASLPYFIPLPIVPFGTLGAVIGMEGSRANRRQLFDLGLAGPLAGLAVTLPMLWLGIRLLPAHPYAAPPDSFCFHNPLILQYLIAWLRPDYPTPEFLYLNQFNSFLMAGWVGLLITGLNMLPVSQLDGGHVAYAVLGRRANTLARALIVASIVYMVVWDTYFWMLMFLLVLLIGPDHPPTVDDNDRLGWFRWMLGWAALLIPVLCFPPLGITPIGR